MKEYYTVTFKYDDCVYCSNIAHAESVADVEKHYSRYEWISVKPATASDLKEAERKGKPVVEIEPEPETEPETAEPETTEPETETTKTASEIIEQLRLSISTGNRKMGVIPSVSLLPVVTCRKNAPCIKDCYARRMLRYPNVKNAYTNNTNLYRTDPDSFFAQLRTAMFMHRFFRLHVSGDFPDAAYFARCVDTVASVPGCTVLAFTKQYEIVNAYVNGGGTIPGNFKIIFSAWGDWHPENPHGLPESAVIFPDTEIPESWKICGGNCFDCACRGCGCWELKNGETIAFYKH